MAKFFEKFAKNFEGLVGDQATNGMDGIPVKSISLKDGKAEFQTELRESRRENLAQTLFEIPAGLIKTIGKAGVISPAQAEFPQDLNHIGSLYSEKSKRP